MDILRQNVGIDVAKKSFVAAFTILGKDQTVACKSTKLFSNSPVGFQELMIWVKKHMVKDFQISYTMEATGVYYELLAYFLWEQGVRVHVILPNKAKKFAESLDAKSKTDNLDAKALGQMGVERNLKDWTLTSKIYRKLKTLTREKEELIKERTRLKNQLHAEQHSGDPIRSYLTRHENHVKYINKQIRAVEKEIKTLVIGDEFISKKIEKVTTIPGIGFITAVTVAAETNGFVNIQNIKQLTSYAGYDVRLRESGRWKGKTAISKQGNSHIRHALYMPSISSVQHSLTYKRVYERLNMQKHNGIISGTAIQRKLLGLIYTLWKNDSEYIENYESKIAS